MYLCDKVGSDARPMKELKDFAKIKLNTDESKRITIVVDKEKSSFYNQSLQWVAKLGDVDMMIGASSEDISLKGRFELKK